MIWILLQLVCNYLQRLENVGNNVENHRSLVPDVAFHADFPIIYHILIPLAFLCQRLDLIAFVPLP